MRGTPDRGVAADITSRNIRKNVGASGTGDRAKVIDAIKRAHESGCKNFRFLGQLKKIATCNGMLTAKQLDALNHVLERHGMARISVTVYDKAKKKRRWEAFKTETNQWHAEMVAGLPKRPPGR